MKSKVTARGQVSIPSEIRKQFNIEPESSGAAPSLDGVLARMKLLKFHKRIEWIVEGNVIKIVPLPKDPVAAFRGRGSRKYSTERLIEERRAEREQEDEKDRSI